MRFLLLLFLTGCTQYTRCHSVPIDRPLVSLGDTISFAEGDMIRKRAIEWTQDGERQMRVTYLTISAVWKTSVVPLFIEDVPQFREMVKCQAGRCTLVVSKHFQYGQNAKRTSRFLVLHQKATKKPLMHHFGVYLVGAGVSAVRGVVGERVRGVLDRAGFCLLDF